MLTTTETTTPALAAGRLVGAAALCLAALAATARARDDAPDGQQIYIQRCAECHGASGEGTELDYPKPLTGDRTLEQLTTVVDETMPSGFPEECTGEDAAAVSAYIYDAFYSPEAQQRNAPPPIELSRLTVPQYRNAVADLIATFRGPMNRGDERGLHAEYFNSGRYDRRRRVLEIVDPKVDFDFGILAPPSEGFENRNEFSIRWEGAVLAPETGLYDIIVESDQATRLFLNDMEAPLVDAYVQSGDMNEHSESIELVGGRVYPLRLEFSKQDKGVDTTRKGDVPASIHLKWRVPGRAVEVIPGRALSPGGTPEVFVVTTPFPPDDRSIGYERGTTVSEAWDNATTDAAIETARYVAANVRDLAGIGRDEKDRAGKVRDFARRFVARAFRRPLTDEEAALFVDRQLDRAPDEETGLKRVVLLALKSPRFLYRELEGSADPYDVASRISFMLWDSIPDQPLLDAAARGELSTREQVVAQAERMVDDLRARDKLHRFLEHWLKIEHLSDLGKNAELYPGFDEQLASDLRTSLDLFLEEIVWSEGSDFRRLLTAETVPLNGRLAAFYGVDLPPDADFRPVTLEPGQRAGVLTHPFLLSGFAYADATSPIHRGVFLARNVLGRTLRPPPAAFSPLAPDLHPDLTTRERVTLQTSPNECRACHGLINPLGFTLEQFDAVGRFRSEENGRPIDATATYTTAAGDEVTIDGARDLAAFLAASEEVHSAFVEQLFHALVKQPVRAYGPRTLEHLEGAFAAADDNIRRLMVEIVATTALTGRGRAL